MPQLSVRDMVVSLYPVVQLTSHPGPHRGVPPFYHSRRNATTTPGLPWAIPGSLPFLRSSFGRASFHSVCGSERIPYRTSHSCQSADRPTQSRQAWHQETSRLLQSFEVTFLWHGAAFEGGQTAGWYRLGANRYYPPIRPRGDSHCLPADTTDSPEGDESSPSARPGVRPMLGWVYHSACPKVSPPRPSSPTFDPPGWQRSR